MFYCVYTKSYIISIIFFCCVFISCVFVLALCIWNVCLISDICIRLWAVIGAQREPYCPARWVDICNYCFVLLGEINNNDDDDSWMPHLVIINLEDQVILKRTYLCHTHYHQSVLVCTEVQPLSSLEKTSAQHRVEQKVVDNKLFPCVTNKRANTSIHDNNQKQSRLKPSIPPTDNN